MKITAQVANFNVVFGEDEKPMLDYFDEVVYPAFKTGKRIKRNEDYFFFHDVELCENSQGDAMITGKIVKQTVLEILSDMDENENLIEKDDCYSSAPYSTFVIYLRNHRMLYVPNQKGSPSLSNFRTITTEVLKEFIRDYNAKKESKIPSVIVKIVGVPSVKSMEELLKSVKKINSLILKFYPLNGDIDFSGVFGTLTTELRKAVGSKTGRITLNSPQSINGVTSVLQQAGGTIDPIINATTHENSKVQFHDYQLSERHEIELDDRATLEQKKVEIIKRASEISTMSYTNENHDQIYERNKKRSKSSFKRK